MSMSRSLKPSSPLSVAPKCLSKFLFLEERCLISKPESDTVEDHRIHGDTSIFDLEEVVYTEFLTIHHRIISQLIFLVTYLY